MNLSTQQQQQLLKEELVESKVYLKTFLISNALTEHGMRVNNLADIRKFIGKDVILTPNKDHPREFTRYKQTGDPKVDIIKFLELQKRHRIGKIVEVNLSPIAQGSSEQVYTAMVELDTDKGKNLYKHNQLPKFVSPSIYKLIGTGLDDIQSFEPLHLALVSSPAYSIRQARVRGSCEDTQQHVCSSRLAQANTDRRKELEKVVNAKYQMSFETTMPAKNVPKRITQQQHDQIYNNNNNNDNNSKKQQQQTQFQLMDTIRRIRREWGVK